MGCLVRLIPATNEIHIRLLILELDLDRKSRTFFVKKVEEMGYNRSVMPLDVLGCTRVTMLRVVSLPSFVI